MEIERRKLATAAIARLSAVWIPGTYKITEQKDARLFKAICDCEHRLNAVWLACRKNNATMRQFKTEIDHWEALHMSAIKLSKQNQECEVPLPFADFPGQRA